MIVNGKSEPHIFHQDHKCNRPKNGGKDTKNEVLGWLVTEFTKYCWQDIQRRCANVSKHNSKRCKG
ncbi:hypothetical protein FR483_n111L [Paramecium bursaria Chlorella virus FR483]|uniref:Uncharacterized protein n111L n=1 Tax=Paramecium bursaria Chlorella virus FR483 TaxID=399781 RepID=A7J6G5_PBCVF|nr:hypothetical protein FR483_n111L [Paramecium bursaria Chlorella virus FR483]ABT15396.1 hypothetical protein FR483_n111L [Paramecium bursaria Chlorella virus FR483]